MPNRHKSVVNTEEILQNRYEETKARLNKLENAGYNVVSIWGYQITKLLRDNPVLENELCSHPYVKNTPLNIRDALYGGRNKYTKIYYTVKEVEDIHRVDVIILWPSFVNMARFPRVTLKGADFPLTVGIGRV